MDTLTATASMRDWHRSGWVITASHVPAVVEAPPPPPTAPDELRQIAEGDYHEVTEDLAVARQALEDYDSSDIGDTTPYSEYRAQRLGTDS